MSPELDNDHLNLGPEYLCFDAGPLIRFNDAGRLDLLESLVGPVAYAPRAVIKCELGKRHKQNSAAIKAPWLYSVPSHPDDAELVSSLLKRLGKKPPKNLGEAEVIAACRRFGWTAVLEDGDARIVAADAKVRHVYVATVLAAASAYKAIKPSQAWKLFVRMEKERRSSVLKPDESNQPVFIEFYGYLCRLREARNNPPFPIFLAEPGLDDVLLELIHQNRSR